ncbi:MAG: integration host factor subunit alpha [Deltaproteobacteria bacterium]|nr:integration host factor subunit alpha [Deltaproteobacteria bacterium]
MTKIDITESICEHLSILKKDSLNIVESLFDIIKDELEKGNDVMISGFGKWSIRSKKARKGRNPQTGKAITIDARKVITFKPSNVLRDKVND